MGLSSLLLLLLLLRVSAGRRYTLESICEGEFTLESLSEVRGSQVDVWEDLGESEPWWSVLSSDHFAGRRDLDNQQLRAFYETGEDLVTMALRGFQGPWTGGGIGEVAVDFGCGVGRIAKALAKRFQTVLCIDHSQRHLDTARFALERLEKPLADRVLTVRSTHAAADVSDQFLQRRRQRPDLVFSVLALQHMIPQLQVIAIENLCDMLAPDAIGFLQLLTFYSDSPYVAANCNPARAIAEPGMHLHYLPLNAALRHLALRGCRPLNHYACDNFVSIPFRNSSSHCIVFRREQP